MKVVSEHTFTNAFELMGALKSALSSAEYFGAGADEVLIVTSESGTTDKPAVLRLFEETLTDGSKVYNIAIRA